MGRTRKKTLLIVLIIAILVTCLGVTVAEIQMKFIRRLIDNVLYDNRNHYLSCEQIPTVSKVMQVVEENQDLIQEIEQMNPGFVGVEIDTSHVLVKQILSFGMEDMKKG